MDRPGVDTAVQAVEAVFNNADVALQLLQHLSARDVARVSTLRLMNACKTRTFAIQPEKHVCRSSALTYPLSRRLPPHALDSAVLPGSCHRVC